MLKVMQATQNIVDLASKVLLQIKYQSSNSRHIGVCGMAMRLCMNSIPRGCQSLPVTGPSERELGRSTARIHRFDHIFVTQYFFYMVIGGIFV